MSNHKGTHTVNLFDFFLLVILFGAGILGYKRGIIVQIASLFDTLISLLVAFIFTDDLAPVIQKFWDSGENQAQSWMTLLAVDKIIYSVIAFFLLFMGTHILLSFFTSLFHRLARFPFLKSMNRVGGILLSVLQLCIIYLFVVHLMNILPLKASHDLVKDSIIAQGLIHMTPGLVNTLKNLLIG